MDNTIIASLIGVIGGLIGAWIGGIISRKASVEAVESANKNAINIINRQEFNRAAIEFRGEFIEVKRLLADHYQFDVAINKDKPTVSEILDEFFISHERAVMRFRPYLSTDQLSDFDNAWEEYCEKDDWQIPLANYSQKGGNDPQKEIEFMKIANT